MYIYIAYTYIYICIYKVWFPDTAEAVNGYELFLHPPTSKKDIAYWINAEIKRNSLGEQLTGTMCIFYYLYVDSFNYAFGWS
jgi:hypothetical protein